MPKPPPDAPLITRWQDHLLKMVGCVYVVEGIETQFIKFKILPNEGDERVILYTTARPYTIKFEEMPKTLQNWIPVQREGVKYYDHLFAELGMQAPPDNQLPVQTSIQQPLATDQNPAPPSDVTPEERFESMAIDFLQTLLDDTKSMEEKLTAAYLNIKDLKAGTAGAAFIQQANVITNIADKMIKGKLTAIQGIKLVREILDKQKKNK